MSIKEFFLRPIGWGVAILIFILSLVSVIQGGLTITAIESAQTNAAGKPIVDGFAALAVSAITTTFGGIGLLYIVGRVAAHMYEGNRAISSRQQQQQ